MGLLGIVIRFLIYGVDVALGAKGKSQGIGDVVDEGHVIYLQERQGGGNAGNGQTDEDGGEALEDAEIQKQKCRPRRHPQKLLERERPDNLYLRLNKLWQLKSHSVNVDIPIDFLNVLT